MDQKNEINEAQARGDRMKWLERQWEGRRLDASLPFVVRLDGHKFSKFTKKYNKPLDPRIKDAMISAAEDVLDAFSARTAFVESDEVTFVFSRQTDPEVSTHMYAGRTHKLCSLMASLMSVRFNHHLQDGLGLAYFDGRCFQVTSKEEVLDAVWWRYKDDTFRNGVNSLAQQHISKKELHGKPLGGVMAMLKAKNIMLNDQDSHLLFGTFIKKQLWEKPFTDPRTGKNSTVLRSVTIHEDHYFFKNLSPELRVEYLLNKYRPGVL
jgi:tRNA(His) 5'-end guanylyltransferase